MTIARRLLLLVGKHNNNLRHVFFFFFKWSKSPSPWNNTHSIKFFIIVTVGNILGIPPTTNRLCSPVMRGSEGTQSSAWESQERRISSNSSLFLFLSFYAPPPPKPPHSLSLFQGRHIICFLSHCSWQKENLVIERYRTCALPARRWQMDYKNFKGEHLEHQGRDARYLNYHSLPRRQWLPDMVHTSRNSANGTDIIQHTPLLLLLSLFLSFSLPVLYI